MYRIAKATKPMRMPLPEIWYTWLEQNGQPGRAIAHTSRKIISQPGHQIQNGSAMLIELGTYPDCQEPLSKGHDVSKEKT
jgi:hypothetical protein